MREECWGESNIEMQKGPTQLRSYGRSVIYLYPWIFFLHLHLQISRNLKHWSIEVFNTWENPLVSGFGQSDWCYPLHCSLRLLLSSFAELLHWEMTYLHSKNVISDSVVCFLVCIFKKRDLFFCCLFSGLYLIVNTINFPKTKKKSRKPTSFSSLQGFRMV